MNHFVGKFGDKGLNFKDKTLRFNLKSVYESSNFSLFSSEESFGHYYHSSENVHLLMHGIVRIEGDADQSNVNGGDLKTSLKHVIERYKQHGRNAIESIDGAFSVILWDDSDQILHLCRDDGGAKLIYYYADNGVFYFSNCLELLVKIYGKPAISMDGLNEYLRFLDISPPHTIYEDVFFLEPDKILSAHGSGYKLAVKKPKTQISAKEPVAQLDSNLKDFKNIFIDSITSLVEKSDNLGAFLSGGIDSSLVCAIAANLRKDLKAYTVGFHDPQFDESPIAKKVAKHLGIKHEILKFSPEQDFSTFLDFCSSVPSPFADPAIVPTFQCFKSVSNSVDLLLDGTGADTLIGVMPARHIRFILNYSRHLPANLRSLISQLLALSKKTAGKKDLFDYCDAAELMIRWKGWSRQEVESLREGVCDCDLSRTMFYQLYNNSPDKTPFELYSKLMGALPDDRIHFSSSNFGPDVVFPFFDRRVQEYVRKLPFKHRYSKQHSKVLFRELLGEYVPREIWDVPKQGFNYPFTKLIRFNQCELVRTYLSDESLSKHGYFDKSFLSSYIDRFYNEDSSVDFKIWALVIFQAWYENFYKRLSVY